MNTNLAQYLYFTLQFFRREPVYAALKDVNGLEYLGEDELRKIQAQRMSELLKYAVEKVPYYRKSFQRFRSEINKAVSWKEVDCLMNSLPFITKDEVQSHYDEFLADDYKKLLTYPDRTSGSTGTPLVFPCDQNAWAYRHAVQFRQMQHYGIEVGEPYGLFFGLHWNKKSRLQVQVRDRVLNRIRVSAFDLSHETFDYYYRKLLKSSPTYVVGYPSAVYDFCLLARENHIDLRKLTLKAIFLTAEPLLAYQREQIESVTGSRCVNQYGSAEGGFTAFECPNGSMHLAVETTWLRLKDSFASPGEALVTDMMLRAFPLINYAIEDEVILSDGICDCGRSHPLLESVNGRSGEPIILPNGRRINANLPSYIFKPLAALKLIRRYRFVQEGRDLKLYLVVSDQFTNEHMKIVEQQTKAAFGSDSQFSTHIVSMLEVLPNGKHKCFVTIS